MEWVCQYFMRGVASAADMLDIPTMRVEVSTCCIMTRYVSLQIGKKCVLEVARVSLCLILNNISGEFPVERTLGLEFTQRVEHMPEHKVAVLL